MYRKHIPSGLPVPPPPRYVMWVDTPEGRMNDNLRRIEQSLNRLSAAMKTSARQTLTGILLASLVRVVEVVVLVMRIQR